MAFVFRYLYEEGTMYNKRSVHWLAFASIVLILLIGVSGLHALASAVHQAEAPAAPAQLYTLSGRVYQGETGVEPPNSKPLEGVTVSLYCADVQNKQGTFLRSTSTDSDGWYGLDVYANDSCNYFNIIESNPSNYTSKGATTVGGSAVTVDWIQYDASTMSRQTLTGNKFWDDLAVLSGRVYEGETGLEPPNSAPIQGVTVSLYCSNNRSSQGSLLRSTTTDSNGWYGLQLGKDDVCEYFNIIETDLPGYTSNGASTMDGNVVTVNWIEFQAPITKDETGNKFWDERAGNTPTPTPTVGPGTPTPTVAPTDTPTPWRPTETPTPTPTPGQPGTADLVITKTFSLKEPVAPGSSTGYYRLRVVNHGPDTATSVVVTDTLPAEFTFTSGDASCTKIASKPPNDVVRCTISSLAPGAFAELTLHGNVDVDFCGVMRNVAEVSSDVPDPNTHDNYTYLDTVVGPCDRPALAVRKRLVSPASGIAAPGSMVVFAVDIFNIGGATLNHIALEDTFDSDRLSYVSAFPVPNALVALPGSGVLKWADLTGPAPNGFGHALAPGDHFSIVVNLRAKAPGFGLNCADVFSSFGDTSLYGEDCDAVDIFKPGIDLVIGKQIVSPAGGVAVVGQVVEFNISLENKGSEPITGIHLRDLYDPSYLSFLNSSVPPDDAVDDGTLDWSDLTAQFGQPLNPGGEIGFHIRFRAKQATSPGQVITNCVQADYHHAQGPVLETDRQCVRLRINSEEGPGISIQKTLYPPGVRHPGDKVRFAFVIENTGTTTLTNVSLVDFYNVNCLHYVPTGWPPSWHFSPDDPTDDGRLDWSNYIASWPQMPPGGILMTWPGVMFEAKAGSSCDPTINAVEAEATDNKGHKAHAVDDEPVRIVGGGGPTPTPTPGGPTMTPTPGPHGGYLIYLPLVLKAHPIPLIFFDDFEGGTLAGWTSNHGTWTNPGDHMHGEYALGNAWNMRAENGGDFIYEGTVNLLTGNAVGLTFRSSADGTSSYDALLDAVDGVFKISKRPPYTVLASYHMAVQRNHPYRIRVVAHGNQIEAYLDDVKRLTVTDGTYTSGHFGVVLFQATADYDDLGAGVLP